MKALLKTLQRSFAWQACIPKAFNLKKYIVFQLVAKNRPELSLPKYDSWLSVRMAFGLIQVPQP